MALEITKPGSPSTITTGVMVLTPDREESIGPVRNVKMTANRKFLAPGTEAMVRPGKPGEKGDEFMASEAEAKDLEARGFAGRAAIDPKAAKAPAAPAAPVATPAVSVKRGPGRPKAKK